MYLNYHDLDANIIIVGAGLTGLSAAFHLLERDPHLDILILDIDDNGKELSNNQDTSSVNIKKPNSNQNMRKNRKVVTFEDEFTECLSSQFVSSAQKDTLKLLKKFDIHVTKNINNNGNILVDYYEIYEVTSRDRIFDFLSKQDAQSLKSFCNKIDQLSKEVSFINPTRNEALLKYDEINMEEFLNELADKKVVTDIISQTFLLNTGLHSKDVSALFFLAYCNSTQGILNQFHKKTDGLYQFQIDGGAVGLRNKFIELIGEESIVKVPTITQISWDESYVGIKTSKEYFFANRAIYTLDASYTEHINFIPHLSSIKKTIFGNSVRGVLKKFGVIYEKPFWMNKNLSGDVYVMDTESSNGPIKICLNFSQVEERRYILIGLANSDSQRDEILQQLSFYFGEEATEPKHYAEQQNSFLDSAFPVGFVKLEYFEDIRRPVGRIIWSSPETTVRWYGCVSGSINAGFNGAVSLLNDIRPHSIAIQDSQFLQPYSVEIPPRRLGLFGFYWHSILPPILIAIFIFFKLKKYVKRIVFKDM